MCDITDHVAKAVCQHCFIDPEDWARGLEELAKLTDQQIDELVADNSRKEMAA